MTTDTEAITFASLIDQLSAEHAELLPCIDDLLDLATTAGAAKLRKAVAGCAARLRNPLEHHIAQEDNVLFPAYAQASGDAGIVEQFHAEHRDILALRDELMAACDNSDDRQLVVTAARLADLLGSHMRREDVMLFPSAREALC